MLRGLDETAEDAVEDTVRPGILAGHREIDLFVHISLRFSRDRLWTADTP